MTIIPKDDHVAAMRYAMSLATKSPPKPTNFRVGAVLVKIDNTSITTDGFTLECPGNTHAEESCFIKLAEQHSTSEEHLAEVMQSPHALYTTMEPCFKRLSGKLPCVERVLRQNSWIKKVYVGVPEPETFVGQNTGRRVLEDAGIEVIVVPGLEAEILQIATAGHLAPEA
ncbi:cytidine and deoxycytidylate deaminase zinc-binding domain containing protein [Cordyceps militaris CM01]|uniref:Cytidine and deoxycytidylate deaminase zinc-binding domain containing protein n=2 Tax=Cordyceps militaris TaxID=73501 RepID=G3JHI7_CORMM|nr:cytidine and deoxycytidylate deaminase zinc-binding domain containing protein [Cordyceps militaris CM01]ATY59067.1 cytidine and deoxycytidylate deaminase zinc-binding domain containing [Cordyceps militaris]EGX90895.1 cytidine and deoxycytidylate deaminase zinc-binding domain containing protein [Cordyceps militaris CM01]